MVSMVFPTIDPSKIPIHEPTKKNPKTYKIMGNIGLSVPFKKPMGNFLPKFPNNRF